MLGIWLYIVLLYFLSLHRKEVKKKNPSAELCWDSSATGPPETNFLVRLGMG